MNNDSACDLTFKKLTKVLSENPALLGPLDFDKAFLVQTGASDITLEAVLSLIMKGKKHPVM